MQEQEELKQDLIRLTGMEWPDGISQSNWEEKLADRIDELILSDFHQLVQLLYRIDIDEPALKRLLQEHPDERAGNIIAKLIVERQLQKVKSRKNFRPAEPDNNEEERW